MVVVMVVIVVVVVVVEEVEVAEVVQVEVVAVVAVAAVAAVVSVVAVVAPPRPPSHLSFEVCPSPDQDFHCCGMATHACQMQRRPTLLTCSCESHSRECVFWEIR